MAPVRLNRHAMYDYLLVFTVLVMLLQIAHILEPPCTAVNSRRLDSSQDIPEEIHSHFESEIGIDHDDPKVVKTVREKVKFKLNIDDNESKILHVKDILGQDKIQYLLKGDGSHTNKKHKIASRNIARLNDTHAEVETEEIQAGKHRKSGAKQDFADYQNSNIPALRKQIKIGDGHKLEGNKVDENKTHNDVQNSQKGVKNKDRLSPRLEYKSQMKPKNYTNKTSFKTIHNPAKCRRSIIIYGGIKVIRHWTELLTFVAALQLQDDGDWSTEVSCDACTVQLTLSNRPNNLKGKDAVVFGMSPYSLKVKMSTFRSYSFDSSQLLVFYAFETPLRMRKWIPDVGILPNHVIWSYAPTADIHIPYGYYQAGTPLDATPKKQSDRGHGKRKLISWMGSNCVKEVFWPRMNFVRKLQSHIPLDVYGKCGNLTCLPKLSEKCQNLMNQYKFYLSLENAECDDYVTEKFWETALMHEVVPVVYGASKEYYIQNAPPNSFIYAGDFKTVKQLAAYLIRLDRSPQKYAKYFDWRYRGTVVQNFPDLKLNHFCGILPHIGRAAEGGLRRRALSETPWFNSCRNMRKGEKAFLPTDVNVTKWVPW